MSDRTPISVLVVDDHDLLREGVSTVLSAFEDIDVIGEVGGDGARAQYVRIINASGANYGPTVAEIAKLKGNAGGYGLDELGDIGARIEEAAKKNGTDEIQTCVGEIRDYLSRLEYEFK